MYTIKNNYQSVQNNNIKSHYNSHINSYSKQV